jgi:ectoine hydroxylase-related dioxygenase (phytanoyl-CoA dioxygenase family)
VQGYVSRLGALYYVYVRDSLLAVSTTGTRVGYSRLSCDEPRWLEAALEDLRILGFAVVEGVLGDEALDRTREALYRAREGVRREISAERLESAGELGVVRIPMAFDDAFFALLELPEVLAIVDRTVSETAVLHLQNGFILPPLPDGARDTDVFQLSFHMDFRRILNGYAMSVNVLLAIDDFSAENGATVVVPGSQQLAEPPSLEYMERHAVPLICPAGSMVVFDSTLWHAAGENRSSADRLAVNHQFTRSYVKQQIDYVRALGAEKVLGQRPRTQQLLGWYTRVVSSLDEYYRPPEDRLYRAGQG